MRLIKRNNKMKNRKFSIGSSVYLVYNKDGTYYLHDDMFEVARVSKDEEGYHYSLKSPSDGSIDWVYGDSIFATRDAAIRFAFTKNSAKG